jgi:hypothetical protein
LPGSALKVPVVVGWWWVGSYPLLSQAPTPVEVELGCDNYRKNVISLIIVIPIVIIVLTLVQFSCRLNNNIYTGSFLLLIIG